MLSTSILASWVYTNTQAFVVNCRLAFGKRVGNKSRQPEMQEVSVGTSGISLRMKSSRPCDLHQLQLHTAEIRSLVTMDSNPHMANGLVDGLQAIG